MQRVKSARSRRVVRAAAGYTLDTLEPRRLMSALPTATQTVSFTVGPMVADPARNYAYVADQSTYKVLTVDTEAGTNVAWTATDGVIGGMAVSPNDSTLLVSIPAKDEIEEYSIPALTKINTIGSGSQPIYSIAESAHGEIYGGSGNTVDELSPAGANIGVVGSAATYYYQPQLKTSADGNTLYIRDVGLSGGVAPIQGGGGTDFYDVSSITPLFTSTLSTPLDNSEDYVVSPSSGDVFTADGGIYGVGVTSIGTQSQTSDYFTHGGYGGSVATLPGSSSVFGADSAVSGEVEEFNIATGSVVNDYPVGNVISRASLVITPDAHLLYAGQSLLGLIGGGSLKVTNVPTGPTISGSVYIDINGAGSPPPQYYTGVANVTIYDDLNGNGKLDGSEPSTVTLSSGAYTLTGTSTGTNHIRAVAPPGYVSTDSGAGTTTVAGSATGVNFPLFKTMTATGLVYNDANGSGARDVSEPGLANLRVFQDVNFNGVYDAGEPSTLTDSSGVYTLNGIIPSRKAGATYLSTSVLYETPAGYIAENGLQTQPYSGQKFTVIVPMTAGSYISGGVGRMVGSANYGGTGGQTVYLDLNNDAVLDNNEPSVITDQNGAFSFGNLPNGSVTLRVQPLPGFTVTYASSATFNVTPLSQNSTAFYVTASSTTNTGGIYGTTFNDANGNAIYDLNELPTVGRTVYLDINSDGTLDNNEPSTVSDSTGHFGFSELAAGSYEVLQVVPTGYAATTAGYNTYLSSSSSGVSATYPVDFGSKQLTGTITGVVYNDANQSGLLDSGEAALANRTVYLDNNNDGVLDTGDVSTTTNSSGVYTFNSVPQGPVVIRQVLPSGWTGTQPSSGYYSTSVGYNQTITANFGSYQPVAGIYGLVFNDINGNGVQDAGDVSIVNRTVYLDLNNDGVFDGNDISTTTNANGYGFSNLPPGTYTVRQILPAGWQQTTASVANTVAGNADAHIVLGSNQPVPTANAGGPYVIGEAGGAGLSAGASTETGNGHIVGYEWDLNYSGTTFNPTANGVTTTFMATGLDGPSTRTVAVRVTDNAGNTSIATAVVNITDVPPTAGFTGSTVTLGSAGTVSFTNPYDPSPDDVAAGFTYCFDFNNDGTLDLTSHTSASATVPASYLTTPGAHTVRGRIQDKDGGFTDYTTTVTVNSAGGTVTGLVTGGPAVATVYLDANNNSKLDTGELSTTAPSGSAYSFSAVPAGAYIIRQVLPSGYTQTSPTNNTGLHITVTNTSKLTGENFVDKAVVTTGSISGSVTNAPVGAAVYLDENNDGILESNEPGTSATAVAGSYNFSFANVQPGSYTLRQVLPSGYIQTSPTGNAGIAVTVTAGGSITGKTFTDAAAATGGNISGTVTGSVAGETIYLDTNNNSKLDTGELSTTTSATGAYSFSNVPVGATILRQVLPTGYTQTTPSGGLGIHVTITKGGSLTNENFVDKAPVKTVTQLTGVTIGTAGSNKNGGNTIAKATDGSLTTFYDGAAANGNWVGLDLGSAKSISQIKFAPRSGYASRMTGGSFQISTTADFSSGVTTLYTISGTPASGSLTTVTLTSPVTARYVRYLSPTGSYGNISEFEVFG